LSASTIVSTLATAVALASMSRVIEAVVFGLTNSKRTLSA
jgi:hypothetical protein